MIFGLVGGPLGCAGLALLLAGRGARVRVAALVLTGGGSALLGAAIAPGTDRLWVALGVAGVFVAAFPLALVLRRVPWLLAFSVLPAVPARVPLDLNGAHSQLWLPLYLLAAAAGMQMLLDTVGGDRRDRELGPVALPLAGFVLWTGVSLLWSDNVKDGSFELLAYYLPFGVIAVGLARLAWSRRALTALFAELTALGLVFAGVGLFQYVTRDVFWNPKVIVSNAYAPFYRVNSVFWDPSIYGRFLMVAIIAALVVLVRSGSTRTAVTAGIAVTAIWAGLIVSYSQSSFAGLIVAVVLLMAVVWQRVAAMSIVLVVLVLLSTGIANPNIQNALLRRSGVGLNKATSDRAGLIYNGVRVAVHDPMIGVGVGGFRHAYASLTHLKGKEPKKAASHDTPVTVAAETGVVGLALFAWLLIAAFVSLARPLRDAFDQRVALVLALVLAAIAVHALFYDHFFEDPTTWGVLGLGALASRRAGREPPSPAPAVSRPAG